jgi:hypothetical protein
MKRGPRGRLVRTSFSGAIPSRAGSTFRTGIRVTATAAHLRVPSPVFELGAVLAVDAMASQTRRKINAAPKTIRTSSLLDPDPVQRQWWLTSADGRRSEIAGGQAGCTR